ncbi:hypothetical protein, partial [Ruegeria meonggei]|uniref:hypothetical protein n=1 Tax=Ruegeria meonggei TaxID=1446476 RepID=UPI001F2C07CE
NSPFDLQTVHWTVCFTIKPRQAHNLKVRGSNPTPANQNKTHHISMLRTAPGGVSICAKPTGSTVEANGRELGVWPRRR